MSARNSDEARIREIHDDIRALHETIEQAGMSRDAFLNPRDRTEGAIADGITYQLYRILEEATNLTDRTKVIFPDVHWDEMRGMRNRLAHDYPGTDFSTVWDVLESGLEELEGVCLGFAEIMKVPLDDRDDQADIHER